MIRWNNNRKKKRRMQELLATQAKYNQARWNTGGFHIPP